VLDPINTTAKKLGPLLIYSLYKPEVNKKVVSIFGKLLYTASSFFQNNDFRLFKYDVKVRIDTMLNRSGNLRSGIKEIKQNIRQYF
jgi:hypothetical protein